MMKLYAQRDTEALSEHYFRHTGHVLVARTLRFDPQFGHRDVTMAYLAKDGWRNDHGPVLEEGEEVTHWMPIPDPPPEAKGGGEIVNTFDQWWIAEVGDAKWLDAMKPLFQRAFDAGAGAAGKAIDDMVQARALSREAARAADGEVRQK